MPSKPRKQFLFLACTCLMLLASQAGHGMGFADSTPNALLGAPLDFRVQINARPDERAELDCLVAEVKLGDRVLPRAAVRAMLEPGSPPAVRVQTLSRVDEPVVEVHVGVGCQAQLRRRYVVFADPPLFVTQASAAAAGATVPTKASAAPPRQPRASAPPGVQPAVAAPGEGGEAPKGHVAGAAARAAGKVVGPGPGALSRPARKSARESASKPARKPRPAMGRDRSKSASKPTGAARAAQAAAAPRLRLDPPAIDVGAANAGDRPDPTARAMEAVDEANKAVLAAMAAASAAQTRLAMLEATVARLEQESRSQSDQAREWRDKALSVQRRADWSVWIALLVLALLALLGWMAWRLRRLETERRQSWLEAVRPPGEAAPPPMDPQAAARPLFAAGLAPPAAPDSMTLESRPLGAESPSTQTRPLVGGNRPAANATVGMSTEELIDLEQQAEFFMVLGQEEAAIDLLVAHLRDSGGASPLPYLKLLDIYHRRGDREAYRRTRERFNQRFNALAPAWETAQDDGGRPVESYTEVLAAIQRAWAHPVEAMTLLEMLLFRHDEGQLFELPAYRELLFLYTLARDLAGSEKSVHERAGIDVDVLLPLGHEDSDGPSSEFARDVDDTPTSPAALQVRAQGEDQEAEGGRP